MLGLFALPKARDRLGYSPSTGPVAPRQATYLGEGAPRRCPHMRGGRQATNQRLMVSGTHVRRAQRPFRRQFGFERLCDDAVDPRCPERVDEIGKPRMNGAGAK